MLQLEKNVRAKKIKYHIQRKSKYVYYSHCYWAEMKISSMRCFKS